MNAPIVIIGSGLAAYSSLREIRKLNPDVQITLISEEVGDFYSKPMLSTAFANQKNAAQLITTSKEKMIEQLHFELRSQTTVLSIDKSAHTIQVKSGSEISHLPYGKLILAVGAEPIRLKLEGSGVGDILTVNALADYAAFRKKLKSQSSVAILGAGLIGCEFANDLITANHPVHVIDLAPQPLGRLLPQEVAARLREKLESIGVNWHLQKSTTAVNKTPDNRFQIIFSDGDSMTVDVVLSAVGLRPKIQLAQDAGLETQRGIILNRCLQTSDPDIFALGDCAEISGLVLTYVMPIMHCAKVIAANVLGERKILSYPAMPVMVKTPALPLIISPPALGAQGVWNITQDDQGMLGKYENADHELLGFVLAGAATKERAALTPLLPPVLSD